MPNPSTESSSLNVLLPHILTTYMHEGNSTSSTRVLPNSHSNEVYTTTALALYIAMKFLCNQKQVLVSKLHPTFMIPFPQNLSDHRP